MDKANPQVMQTHSLAEFYRAILSSCLGTKGDVRIQGDVTPEGDGVESQYCRVAILGEGDLQDAWQVDAEKQALDEGQGSHDAVFPTGEKVATVRLKWPTAETLGDSSTNADLRELKYSFEQLVESQCRFGIATSGTTGRPKLIWHSLASLTRNVKQDDRFANDRWGFGYAPASFAGLQVFLQAFANRNYLRFLPADSADKVLTTIRDERLNRISATPSYLRLLTTATETAPEVETVTFGGEGADEQLVHRLRRTFPNAEPKNVYASTEAGSLLVSSGNRFIVPAKYAELVRVGDRNSENIGQLEIHHSLLAESVQQGFNASAEAEFFATGDLVEVLGESPLEFRFRSRRDDWINVGGTKVDPQKIEAVLIAQAGIADARVYAKPNSVLGSIVCAQIVCESGQQRDVVQWKQELSRQLSRYEVPQIIEVVERVELNATGKKWRR